ncbi:Ion transport protein-domain-containing protein [Dichotomocladium elegans]|nr:Ion transport protein-domain-containing protein [Dichotomocladium elegans]
MKKFSDTNGKALPSYSNQRQSATHHRRSVISSANQQSLHSYVLQSGSRPLHQYSTDHYPPLTADRLEKKNKLDILLQGRISTIPSTSRPRRRSISNGYIYRRPYRDINPMAIPDLSEMDNMPSTTGQSMGNDTSSAELYPVEHTLPEGRSSDWLGGEPGAKKLNGESMGANGSNHSSVLGYIRSRHRYSGRQKTVSSNPASQITSHRHSLSKLLKITSETARGMRGHKTVDEPDIYAAAAAAAAAVRASSLPKAAWPFWRKAFAFLEGMAQRAVDTRSCEPYENRIDVEEMLILAEYLNASPDLLDSHRNSRPSITLTTKPPDTQRTSVFIDQVAAGSPLRSQQSSPETQHPLESPVTPFTDSSSDIQQSNRLGSLGSIFPYRRQSLQKAPPSVDSYILPESPNTHQQLVEHVNEIEPNTGDAPRRKARQSSAADFLRRFSASLATTLSGPINIDRSKRPPSIHFEGWSLWVFGPNNPIRLALWKVVASKRFNLLILFLVFLQWLILSFVPIRANKDKTDFHHPYQYAILAINIIYTQVTTNDLSPNHRSIRSVSAIGTRVNGQGITDDDQFYQLAPWSPIEDESQSLAEFPMLRRSPSPYGTQDSNTQSYGSSPSYGNISGRSMAESASDEDGSGDAYLKISHTAYLADATNLLDLIAISAYWIDLVLMLCTNDTWSLFKAIAAARVLRLAGITEGTAIIIRSLRSSFDMLCNVLGFFAFFWVLLALLAVLIFMNAFSRRCAVMENGNITFVEPRAACNNHYTLNGTLGGVYDLEKDTFVDIIDGDGFICQIGQICVQSAMNRPGYGYMNYKNFLYAMLNVFTVISTEGWTDLMYLSQDSISGTVGGIYYCFVIYLMTFIMVPMFIAVITNSFANARGDMRHSAFATEKKPRLLLTRTINGKNTDDAIEQWIYGGSASLMSNAVRRRTDRLRRWAYYIMTTRYFPYIGSILVALNMVSMGFYSGARSPGEIEAIHRANFIFTLAFSLEISIRIAGSYTWQQFWKFYHILFFGYLVHNIQIIFIQSHNSFYHLFPVLRAYRLVYLFPRVLDLLSNVIGDGQGIINLTFLTFWILFLLCPISIQLFGGDFNKLTTTKDTEMRFDTFFQAFLALFQILTGENWTQCTANPTLRLRMQPSLWFSSTLPSIVQYTSLLKEVRTTRETNPSIPDLVLNLFIAVIMENFDLDEDEIKQIQIKNYVRQHRWQPEYYKLDPVTQYMLPFFLSLEHEIVKVEKIPKDLTAEVTRSGIRRFLTVDQPDQKQLLSSLPTSRQQQQQSSSSRQFPRMPISRAAAEAAARTQRTSSVVSNVSTLSSIVGEERLNDDFVEPLVKYGDEYETNVAKENKDVIIENLQTFRSIFILKSSNPIRKWCVQMRNSRIYNAAIITLLYASVVLAVWNDKYHRSKDPRWADIQEQAQRIMLVFFWLDVFIHIVSDGLFVLHDSYLRSAWNVVDLAALTAQVLSIAFIEKNKDGWLRALRMLRAIRAVYYVEEIRVIFLDLLDGLPTMIDAVILNLIVFVAFGVYGCYLFSGRFAGCNDNDLNSKSHCMNEFKTSGFGIWSPRAWVNPYKYSYDTFGAAMLHLFECASGEGWIMSLFSAMSVPFAKDQQPSFSWESNSTWHSLYYVCFMFLTSLCSIQLFIGVILETFKRRRGISSLTNTQRQFQDLQRQLSLVRPSLKNQRPPNGTIRAFCYDIVINKRGWFTQFMSAILMMNIQCAYYVFIGFFVLEIALKMFGTGIQKYLSSKWNIYDFVVIMILITVEIVEKFLIKQYWFDVFRKMVFIAIPFRLAQRNEALDTLFRSVNRAMPNIIYVTCALAVVMTCFAVIVEELFATTRYGPYGNNHANFRSFWNSFQTLWRITTGENWDFLMHDFAVEPYECVNDDDCGSPVASVTVFVIFYVVCTYIFVNLFTVIVINNFSFTFDTRNQFTLITRTDLRHFKEAWSEYDPKATGYIRKTDIPAFLRDLQGVLAIRVYEPEHSLHSLLDASNEMDPDVGHLVSVPMRSGSMVWDHNVIGEQFYNYDAVNRRLATMDVEAVRQNKKKYELVYQEVMFAVKSRGIAFHDMLCILAMQLVDVSKSLTFDALVHHARNQDRITRTLASKRAKSLVSMLIQRRQYLKERERIRNEQVLDMSMMEGFFPQRSHEQDIPTNGLAHPLNHSASLARTHSESSLRHSGSYQRHYSISPVPAIVVEQAHLPPPAPISAQPALIPSLGAEDRRSSSMALPKIEPHWPSFSAHISVTEPFYDQNVDTFTRYYAFDPMLDMIPQDADRLMEQLGESSWSEWLQEEQESLNPASMT